LQTDFIVKSDFAMLSFLHVLTDEFLQQYVYNVDMGFYLGIPKIYDKFS